MSHCPVLCRADGGGRPAWLRRRSIYRGCSRSRLAGSGRHSATDQAGIRIGFSSSGQRPAL